MCDLSGQQIKGYVISELIGTGGFAAVYKARQPSVEREVAIKVILPKHANNPNFVRRFETEAQLIARLEHLHIVPLYDFWREPDNAYLVMRWLRGGTLHDSLSEGAVWSLEAIARLLDQITAALTVAHRNGVIHQDLTPANILFDDDGNAYLADFGIAKDLVAEEEAEDGERLVFGSPAYMAPEQITRETLSPQTDIYSLGIVLFQMLAGETPFDAPTHTTVIRQQVQAPLPPLQSVRSDLPVDLNMVVLRALAKQPQLRYPDALH
ncbi:MAG: serine/threonine protein kinase, partial [Anaerolineae bacterium]|nr:serine/threonine protein kinase [Anaerolineae bacterium]